MGIVRAGGAVGRVDVQHHDVIPGAQPMFSGDLTVSGGPAPVRSYIDELLPDVLDGRIEPGRMSTARSLLTPFQTATPPRTSATRSRC